MAGVSFLGFRGCSGRGSLPTVPWGLECGGIVALGPRSSRSPRSVLFGDIGPAGVWHMVGGGGGAASIFQFGSRSFFPA